MYIQHKKRNNFDFEIHDLGANCQHDFKCTSLKWGKEQENSCFLENSNAHFSSGGEEQENSWFLENSSWGEGAFPIGREKKRLQPPTRPRKQKNVRAPLQQQRAEIGKPQVMWQRGKSCF